MLLTCARRDRFINSLIFLDQKQAYETWVLVAVFLSIAVLIGGVVSHIRRLSTYCLLMSTCE